MVLVFLLVEDFEDHAALPVTGEVLTAGKDAECGFGIPRLFQFYSVVDVQYLRWTALIALPAELQPGQDIQECRMGVGIDRHDTCAMDGEPALAGERFAGEIQKNGQPAEGPSQFKKGAVGIAGFHVGEYGIGLAQPLEAELECRLLARGLRRRGGVTIHNSVRVRTVETAVIAAHEVWACIIEGRVQCVKPDRADILGIGRITTDSKPRAAQVGDDAVSPVVLANFACEINREASVLWPQPLGQVV